MLLTRQKLARMIDHTQVRAYATEVDLTELCEEAARLGVAAVSVNPVWVSYCKKCVAGTTVAVNAAVGFPLGASTAYIKVQEARDAIRNGATELDMVINIGAVKSGFPSFVEREIAAVVKAAGDVPVKVILETSFLTDEEKKAVCAMSVRAGASCVSTSTGFGQSGATPEHVRLMREVVMDEVGVKAAGGIRTLEDAQALIEAGATRIGTSATVEILDSLPS